MPSRRRLLAALGPAAAAGSAGCLGRIPTLHSDDRTVEGPCEDPGHTWPTAGDPGRTGRTDTAPPAADADVVDLLAGVRVDGRQRRASTLPAVGAGVAYVPTTGGIVALDLDAPAAGAIWSRDVDDVDAVPALTCGVVLEPGLNQLVALDPATGERYWRSELGSHGEVAVAALDETVFVGSHAPVAVAVRTGEVQWRAEGGDTVAVDETGVYSTLNNRGTGGIFAHDLDGGERWHLALGTIVGSASVLDGTVWVADDRGSVFAIDAPARPTGRARRRGFRRSTPGWP